MNGVRIQMPRFADDTAILAQGEVNKKKNLDA